MSAKIYLRILQIGIIASLAIIFFVFPKLLFPYITSKQIPFNILIEVLLVFWLVFVWRYPKYRPKKNYITTGLIAYFIAILASCLVSVDFNLSFWGDAERMLGFFHLFHFLIFYYILITVFRTWREWKILLLSSVVIASIVSLIGLIGTNVYSVIGNTAYVSGYLIFNLFFSALLFFREKNRFWRWLYLLPAIVMLLEFKAADTSGGIIGLAVGILLLFFLLGIFHKRKNIRIISLVILILAVLTIAGIFSQRNSDWFQDNDFLNELTFQKDTFQTRLISWHSAWLDFRYHPIFGTGFGNYAIIFDKHFDSKFFDHARTETYFDRAHNNLIDIASTTGLVGLITYISIFIAVLYYLWTEFKRNGRRIGLEGGSRRNLEIVVIIALLGAYFVQNLAVFDSFTTYIALMMLLGFIYWIIKGKEGDIVSEEEIKTNNPIKELIVFLIILGVIIFAGIQFNVRSWRMFSGVISGYAQIVEGNLWTGFNTGRRALDNNNSLNRDGRVLYINLTTANPNLFYYLNKQQAQEVLDYIISLAEKNAKYNPKDSLMQLQLAQILDTVARTNYDDLDRFNYYSSQAVQAMEKSIEASPRRAPLYLIKGQILLARGERDKAIETIKYGINLNPNFPDGHCRLAQVYLLLEENDNVRIPLDKCIELNGVEQIKSDRLLKDAINYYANEQELEQAIVLTERLSVISEQDPEVWFNLVRLYLAIEEEEKARIAADKAIDLDSRLKEIVDELFGK